MSVLIFSGALLLSASPQPIVAYQAPLPAITLPLAPIDTPPLVQVAETPAPAPGEALPNTAPAGPPPAPPANPQEGPQKDIVVTGRAAWEAPDPFADVNEKAFEIAIAADSVFLAPLARIYKDVIPKPVRDGAHNFLYNFREPVVFLNFVLQLKIGRALETAGRFVINSTVGVLGIFDIAKRKPFKWKRRSNGFANTLGFYGVKSGPYMYIPVAGPTTPRDLIGGALDRLLFPFVYGTRITKPEFAIPYGGVSMLDHRSDFDDAYTQLRSSKDPYAATRDFYLQRRQNEIDELKGKGQKNSSGMSEAPTQPFVVKPRSGTTLEDAPVEATDAPVVVTPPAPEAPKPAPVTETPPSAPTPMVQPLPQPQ